MPVDPSHPRLYDSSSKERLLIPVSTSQPDLRFRDPRVSSDNPYKAPESRIGKKPSPGRAPWWLSGLWPVFWFFILILAAASILGLLLIFVV